MIITATKYTKPAFAPQKAGVSLWALVVALSVIIVGTLDVLSTNAGLLAGAVETNPLMAAMQDLFGWWWFVPKMGLQFITVAIVLMHPVRAVFMCVSAVIAFNAFVVLNNFALSGVI